MLGFTACVALASGLFFGLIPVLRYRRPNFVGAINEGTTRASTGRETNWIRSGLVVAQVALALVLLVGSGLMARSFFALGRVHCGFEPENLLTLRLSLPSADYPEAEDAARFYQRLLTELESLPGVSRVGAVSNFPMTDSQSNNGTVLEDFPLQPDEIPPIVRTNFATPRYFETLGIPLNEGRTFERRDHEEPAAVAVVSAAFAKEFWPDASALGRRVTRGLPAQVTDVDWYTIVGVVGDVRDDGLSQDAPKMIYFPVVGLGGAFSDWTVRTMTVAMRAGTDPMGLAAAARDKVWALDANLPIVRLRTGASVLTESTARTSYIMILLGIAASVALLLGAIGIYGVISYIVSQRTREIGIRMALGAARADVSRMVVGQGMRLALMGVTLGVVGALVATRLMMSLLYGVRANDPVTFVSTGLFLLAVTVAATYIPARRAAGASPVRALHYE